MTASVLKHKIHTHVFMCLELSCALHFAREKEGDKE